MQHGLFYNGTAIMTLDHPSATNGTVLTGISDRTAVGNHTDSLGTHGFVVTNVPEPSDLLLAAAGIAGIVGVHGRRRWRHAT